CPYTTLFRSGLSIATTGHWGPRTTLPVTPESEAAVSLEPALAQATRVMRASVSATRFMVGWTAVPGARFPASAGRVGLRLEQGHVGQVAVPLVVVEAVPHDEFRRDLEPPVLD